MDCFGITNIFCLLTFILVVKKTYCIKINTIIKLIVYILNSRRLKRILLKILISIHKMQCLIL